MSSYKTLSQTLFQGVGGFAIAQLLLPRSFYDPKYAEQLRQRGSGRESPADGTLEQNVRRLVCRIQLSRDTPPCNRTLPQDISVLSEKYRTLWTLGVASMVVCGGPMALLGAGTAVAFMGEEGSKRYTKMKQWFESR